MESQPTRLNNLKSREGPLTSDPEGHRNHRDNCRIQATELLPPSSAARCVCGSLSHFLPKAMLEVQKVSAWRGAGGWVLFSSILFNQSDIFGVLSLCSCLPLLWPFRWVLWTSLKVVICDKPGKLEVDCRSLISVVCVYSHVSPCPTRRVSVDCHPSVKDLPLSVAVRGFDILDII